MILLSPGLAQGAFEMMGIISRHDLSAPDLTADFVRLGGVGAADVLALAQTLNWITVGEQGFLALSLDGERVLQQGGYEFRLRQAVMDYVDILSPPWLQNATYGRSRVLSFAGSGVAQVLVEAGVAEGVDDGVVEFWDRLAALARGQKDDRLLAIGRVGERLTLAHEVERTGVQPRWVAIDSNEDGYDILSTVSRDDTSPLAIEVKSSRMGAAGALFLTRNEWERALDATQHVFHLWDLGQADHPRLAVVPAEQMSLHLPQDLGRGAWDQVQVPFAAFTDRFVAQSDDMAARS